MTATDNTARAAGETDSPTLPLPPPGPDDRSLLSLAALGREALADLVDAALAFSQGAASTSGAGRLVGTYFALTSTRTRTSFTAAAHRLGANVIAFGPSDLQLATGETVADTGRVLAGMLDVLVARTGGPAEELQALSSDGRLPVINAMTDTEHPTQAIADLATIKAHLGTLEGATILCLGEGNSTAAALALGVAVLGSGLTLELRTPPGYGLPASVLRTIATLGPTSALRIRERHDMIDLPAADIVYTTQWRTTGTAKADADWMERFRPFAVTNELLSNPRLRGAAVMHDLPARRGEEIEHGLLEDPACIAFAQAQMKLHGATAVLDRALRGAR